MTIVSETGALCLVSQVTAADVCAIEAGLHELWRLAEAGAIGGSIVRAASMTVLVPVADDAEADAVSDLLDDLADSHPCRALLLLADDRVAEPRARLASHSRRSAEGEATRYWEEIRLVSSSSALHQTMSLVQTLALPGLPVQTWWPDELDFDGDLFNHVVDVSDRLVLDTSRFPDPVAALPQLAAAIRVANQSIAFADLSWTRLTPWRLLVAEFFDAPEDQSLLDSIERVTIEYAADVGGEASQALLLLGWIGSRLGWEPHTLDSREPSGWRFDLLDGVRPVRAEITRVPAGDPSARLADLRAVTIVAAEGERRATYTVQHCGNDEARSIKDDGTRLEGRGHLPKPAEAELLHEELGGFAPDRIYQESLDLVGRLLEMP